MIWRRFLYMGITILLACALDYWFGRIEAFSLKGFVIFFLAYSTVRFVAEQLTTVVPNRQETQ